MHPKTIMPRYDMDTAGTHHGYGWETDFTHKGPFVFLTSKVKVNVKSMGKVVR